MLQNYIRIAFRNLKKDKIFSLINILGLAVGITCFITLFLFIKDELSFDKFNKNSDQIFRLYSKIQVNGSKEVNSKTSGALGPTLLKSFPEVQAYTRIGYFGPRTFRINDIIIKDGRIYAVDSNFFSIFTLPFLHGNSKTALNRPNSLVMTETTAKRYFGTENPVGKTLSTENGKDFLVTGVIKDFPKNSHFSCNFLESMSTYQVNLNWLDNWFTTYIMLRKDTDPAVFNKKLDEIVKSYVAPTAEAALGVSMKQFLASGNSFNYLIQPLSSIYLSSQRDYEINLNTEWSDVKTSDIIYVYIFSAVAIFILLIAVFNFMNLATARSEKRAKEVGIRKTLGSNKMRLILQFVSEAILMSMFSLIVSIGFLEFTLPLFNRLSGKELTLDLFGNLYSIFFMLAFSIIVGILAGSYPAFYLSSFQPMQVLKTASGKRNRKNYIRSGLVIIQFAVSIILLIGTIIVKSQLDYLQNKNLGFNKDYLVSINNAGSLGNKMEAFKQELLKNSRIISVTNSSRMFEAGIPGSGYLYNKKSGTDPILCQYLDVDYDFLKTFQIKLLSGRFFSKEFSTDTSAVVVNEAAARIFNSKDTPSAQGNPLGKELTSLDARTPGITYRIIGIMKNFNYESLHQEVRPLVLNLGQVKQPANILTVRILSSNIKGTLGNIEQTWKRFVDDEDIYYNFVDENLQHLYEREKRTGIIASIFTVLAIFIACLGLFGLAAFVTEQRTKEIGIRKVLGASLLEIVSLLSKEFTIWVLIANLIAWPIAYFIMRNWLDNFAFKITISIWVFILSGLLALMIALLTISIHAVKAAAANPVESLKFE